MIYLILLCGALAYLLGSINTSIIVSACLGTDVRKSGSGNAGATNTLRTLGKLPAVIVVLGDIAKGILAILLSRLLLWIFPAPISSRLPEYAAALCVVLGHNFPIYFGFKGGKGILTSLAVVLMLDWRIGLIVLAVSVIIIASTRFVSLGSCIGAIVFPICVLLFHMGDWYLIVLSLIMAALALFMHRQNIRRLMQGTEPQISFHKKG